MGRDGINGRASDSPPNSALLPDAFSSLRCASGAAKRERYTALPRR